MAEVRYVFQVPVTRLMRDIVVVEIVTSGGEQLAISEAQAQVRAMTGVQALIGEATCMTKQPLEVVGD